ncbi:MAG TPA: hypothetical protein VG164_03140 [Trebonia sp.]|nr:hypothetical protein [Trebonia sp.]
MGYGKHADTARKEGANTRFIRYHSSDDMAGLGEFRAVTEPVAVVLRKDGSVDVYGYVAVVDQRPGFREEAASGQRLTAHFTPEAWQRDQAIEVDPQGPQEWDCTGFARLYPGYVQQLAENGDLTRGVTDNDDLFHGDPAAPAWVRAWSGPFTITIRQNG